MTMSFGKFTHAHRTSLRVIMLIGISIVAGVHAAQSPPAALEEKILRLQAWFANPTSTPRCPTQVLAKIHELDVAKVAYTLLTKLFENQDTNAHKTFKTAVNGFLEKLEEPESDEIMKLELEIVMKKVCLLPLDGRFFTNCKSKMRKEVLYELQAALTDVSDDERLRKFIDWAPASDEPMTPIAEEPAQDDLRKFYDNAPKELEEAEAELIKRRTRLRRHRGEDPSRSRCDSSPATPGRSPELTQILSRTAAVLASYSRYSSASARTRPSPPRPSHQAATTPSTEQEAVS